MHRCLDSPLSYFIVTTFLIYSYFIFGFSNLPSFSFYFVISFSRYTSLNFFHPTFPLTLFPHSTFFFHYLFSSFFYFFFQLSHFNYSFYFLSRFLPYFSLRLVLLSISVSLILANIPLYLSHFESYFITRLSHSILCCIAINQNIEQKPFLTVNVCCQRKDGIKIPIRLPFYSDVIP